MCQFNYPMSPRMVRRFLLILTICLAVNTGEAGTLAGIVTEPDGVTPVAGFKVTAWRTASFLWTGKITYTAANGRYAFTSLSAGTYRVEFSMNYDPSYAHETYDNSPLLSGGTDIEVTADSVNTNVNASLALASRIAGKVFGPDGFTGLSGISTWAYRHDGPFGWRRMGEFSDTGVGGAYSIGGLAEGPYRVQYEDGANGDYITQVYTNAGDLDEGIDIVLPVSATVSNINISLAQAGKISGHLYATGGVPLSDAYVAARYFDGFIWQDAGDLGSPDGTGLYTVGGLSSGMYRVEFVCYSDDILDEVYDNELELERGRDVAVAAGSTVSNIDATLDMPAWPPRIVRLSSGDFGVEVAYTSTSGAACVLQETPTIGNGWSNVLTAGYTIKGVNILYPNVSTGKCFWRIESSAAP